MYKLSNGYIQLPARIIHAYQKQGDDQRKRVLKVLTSRWKLYAWSYCKIKHKILTVRLLLLFKAVSNHHKVLPFIPPVIRSNVVGDGYWNSRTITRPRWTLNMTPLLSQKKKLLVHFLLYLLQRLKWSCSLCPIIWQLLWTALTSHPSYANTVKRQSNCTWTWYTA